MTPTRRTLIMLRRAGWLPAVVERWLPRANLRADLWGFGDVLAVHPQERRFLIVQATTVGHVANRLSKARSRPELALWLAAGGAFEVHGWGLANGRWYCKRVSVSPEDLKPVIVNPLPRQHRRSRWHQGTLFEQQ